MAVTIALDDNLAAALEDEAKKHRLSVEQFAVDILTRAVEPELATLEQVVTRIQTTPPNPTGFRPAAGDLADALRDSPDDPEFDVESWNRRWSQIQAEIKSVTKANDVAEGRC